MKPNLRSRNLQLNSYIAILIVTVTGAFASFFILHVAYDLPLQQVFAAASPQDLGN